MPYLQHSNGNYRFYTTDKVLDKNINTHVEEEESVAI